MYKDYYQARQGTKEGEWPFRKERRYIGWSSKEGEWKGASMVIRRNRREVEFHFYKPHAHDVSLAGDFNNWNPGATPMCQSQDGDWVCRMALPEGIYHFKYVADGKWYPDYAAFGLEPGPYGLNSVLLVEKLTDTIQPSVQPSVPKQNPHKTRRHPPHSRFKCSVA